MTDALQAAANLLSTLLSRWTQTDRLLHLHTVLDTTHGPNVLLAEQLRCVEGIGILDDDVTNLEEASTSHGFKFELTALSQDSHLELKALIGQPVLLEMLTSASRTNLRPFHGYITRVECVGSNGGVARYKLIIEPWIAFLSFRRDSTTYQDMTVFDIIESVFKDYEGQGKLIPAWRLDIADRTLYPKRSLTTQYQESDLAFIERLMNEEGLFYWFEHEGNAQSTSLGAHTMVIADHNEAFKPNAQSVINFTQPGAVMKSDSIDRWRSERRWQTNAIELVSWDYRSVDTRPVAAHSSTENSTDSMPLVSQDAPGVYSYENREQGQRIANNQLQALEAHNKLFTGAGTVRTLSPGTTFSLQGHAELDQEIDSAARTFVILRIVHLAHNNLSAELQSQIELALGLSELNKVNQDVTALDNLHATGNAMGERPLYRNRMDVIHSSIPYRSLYSDDQGRMLHPKPTVFGQQTAIVVGSGGPIHTDRDHRIKVQFHWQRGQNSHSRLSHPSTDGHTGAPANEQAGTWVRVATPLAPIAGTNWGSHALPRVGQEVLVDFVEGDIDRPVVIGSLYNGKGQADAQSNQFSQGTGVATGNASAWFPGEQAGHAHPAALSGIKTQSMNASQSGGGAYNQLVFDDSPGQSRTVLQNHASPHQGTAELNLGHLRHQSDNQRLNPAGFGAELKTRHSAALRAGQGLLLSTHARPNASSTQLDSREALAQIEQSQQLQANLADTAQKHNAKLLGEPAPDKLPAIAQMLNSIEVVTSTTAGASDGTSGGAGQVTAYSEPHMQFSSPSGIAASTPANAIFAAGNTS
ncbi:type VI secretion system Vgr family protein, partial [Sulfurirhabdus autotrophica]